MRRVAGFVPCLILLAHPPADLPPPATDPVEPPAFSLRRVREDLGYLVRRPARASRRGRDRLGLVAGSTVLLYALRDGIRDEVRERQGPGRGRFLRDVRTMGKGGFAPALAVAALGVSLATREERERETALLLLESAAVSSALAVAGSFALAAERPREGNDIRLFRRGGHGVSLDAALAASVVPTLRRQYLWIREGDGRWKRAWKRGATAALYAGAALTALQRLHDESHWAPDAFLGTMTGLSVGEALCDAHGLPGGGRRGGESAVGWSLGPGTVTVRIPVGRRGAHESRGLERGRYGR